MKVLVCHRRLLVELAQDIRWQRDASDDSFSVVLSSVWAIPLKRPDLS